MYAGFLSFQSLKDKCFLFFLCAAAFCTVIIVFLIYAFVLWEGFPHIEKTGWLLADKDWYPLEGEFNFYPTLVGSMLVALFATMMAGIVGFFIAVGINFYSPKRISQILRSILEMMAGIPSVIYGVWGLTILVPFIGSIAPPGTSLLSGSLVLAMMITPFFTLFVDRSIRNISGQLQMAVVATDLSRWRSVSVIYWPLIKHSLCVGLVLATTRAFGETMIVLMVCGNVPKFPVSLFSSVRTLTSTIALEMPYALGDHQSALFFLGFLLLTIISVLVALASLAFRGSQVNYEF